MRRRRLIWSSPWRPWLWAQSPPPDDFPAHDDLPPPPPLPLLPAPDYGEPYDTLQTPGAPRSPRSSPRVRQRPPLPQLYSLSQYLPQHHYPLDHPDSPGSPFSNTLTSNTTPTNTTAAAAGTGGSGGRGDSGGGYRGGFPNGYEPPALDNMSLSLYTSTASCSDMSACCEESEAMLSDYESGDDAAFECLTLPSLDSQQHTEV